PVQEHEGRVHHRGRRPRLAQEGVHPRRPAARLQHHVLRRPQGRPPAQAVRPRVQGPLQRVPALRVRPRLLLRGVLQGRRREGLRGERAVADQGPAGQGPRGHRGPVALRQAELAPGPRADVQLLPGHHHPQERLRLRHHQPDRGRVDQDGDEAVGGQAHRVDQLLEALAGVTAHLVSIAMGGVFHAAILFLVAAGLQVVFGVQKIFNLACGSFYALGAYVGVSAVPAFTGAGGPPALFVLPLAAAGLAVGLVGLVVERGLLRFVYDRDEAFQLLLTFAIVLMMEDLIRMTWGTAPYSTAGLYLVYGQAHVLGATVPVYNLVVIAASLAIAAGLGRLRTRTASGGIIRATADNREMAEALGVDMRRVYARVFTLGTALGTLGGALVIPATAAMSEMGIELIVEAFAVVVIGGLGSMRGALVGRPVVGSLRPVARSGYPELEMLLIYLIVIAVLVARPRGLFGGAATWRAARPSRWAPRRSPPRPSWPRPITWS